MGTKRTWNLGRESVYWAKMNADIKQRVKQCAIGLKYQGTQPHETALHYEIPQNPGR